MSRQGEAQSRTTENVKDFWNKEADEWGDNPQVTIRDHYFRLLELNTIAGSDKLLDIGCGTGFSTLFYAQGVRDAVGAEKIDAYEQQIPRIVATAPDFSTCSHQVLFHFEKKPA